MFNFCIDLCPTRAEQILLAIGGAIGTVLGWATGGISEAFYWLLAFCVVDYASGMIKAIITHTWSSAIGFKGLMKKVLVITTAILAHGLGSVAGMPVIETAIIFAFAVNEAGSILENVEKAGFGSVIPPILRTALAAAQEKEKELEKGMQSNGTKQP